MKIMMIKYAHYLPLDEMAEHDNCLLLGVDKRVLFGIG
jgi:hypothetical protein